MLDTITKTRKVEKSLPIRMQLLLDQDEDYTELCAKCKKTKKGIDELDFQRANYLEKIQTNKAALKKYEAEVMEADPSKLDALKVKMGIIEHQILADGNWIQLIHQKRVGKDKEALKELEKERFQKFCAIITSLRSQQHKKAEDCLKQAVGVHRLWAEAVNKLRNDNQVQGSGSDDVYLMNSAYDLGLDFTGRFIGDGVEKFEFSLLVRKYG